MVAGPPFERRFLEEEHDEQRKGSDRCCGDEHAADAVGHIRLGTAADVRGEDGAEHRCPDGSAQRAEEARGRCRDAELSPLDAVLHGHHQHLGDHAEAEPEDGEGKADLDARGVVRDGGEQGERHSHQAEPDDRESLVATRLGDQPARHRRRDRDPEHDRDQQQPRLRRRCARLACRKSGTNTVTAKSAAVPRKRAALATATTRVRSRCSGTSGSAARRSRTIRPQAKTTAAAMSSRIGRVPGVAIPAPDAGQHERGRGHNEQGCAGQVERRWAARPRAREGARSPASAIRPMGRLT